MDYTIGVVQGLWTKYFGFIIFFFHIEKRNSTRAILCVNVNENIFFFKKRVYTTTEKEL